jgi:hypothetical protein
MKRVVPAEAPAMRIDPAIESGPATEIIPVHNRPAVGDPRIVVVNNPPAVVPVVSPVVPSPPEAAEESDAEPQSEGDSRAIQKQSWIRIPAGKDCERSTVYQPRIVLGYVDLVGHSRLNYDRFIFGGHLLLCHGIQIPGLLRPLSHDLNCLSQLLLLVHMGVA